MDLASRRFTWLYAKSQLGSSTATRRSASSGTCSSRCSISACLSFVFSVVNRMRMGDYAVFLFSALVPWRYFEKVVTTCMDAIVQGDWLLKKLPVSPFALPLPAGSSPARSSASRSWSPRCCLTFLKKRWTVHVWSCRWPRCRGRSSALGLGLFCATLFTFFRDIRPIVQMALMFAFFSAPILFRPRPVPGRLAAGPAAGVASAHVPRGAVPEAGLRRPLARRDGLGGRRGPPR